MSLVLAAMQPIEERFIAQNPRDAEEYFDCTGRHFARAKCEEKPPACFAQNDNLNCFGHSERTNLASARSLSLKKTRHYKENLSPKRA